jgi:hypothetical protein
VKLSLIAKGSLLSIVDVRHATRAGRRIERENSTAGVAGLRHRRPHR